jgi:hypothetical protein
MKIEIGCKKTFNLKEKTNNKVELKDLFKEIFDESRRVCFPVSSSFNDEIKIIISRKHSQYLNLKHFTVSCKIIKLFFPVFEYNTTGSYFKRRIKRPFKLLVLKVLYFESKIATTSA